MKRYLSLFLAFVLILSICSVVRAENFVNTRQTKDNMVRYIGDQEYKKFLYPDGYQYIDFLRCFSENLVALSLANAADKLIETGDVSNIDEEKYIEVLTNMMALSEYNDAPSMAEQNKQDNLKSAKDYAMDITQMGVNAIGIMTGTSEQVSELKEMVTTAVGFVGTLAKSADNWAESIGNLETILQNYDKHMGFLSAVAANSEGNLKTAASKLQDSLKNSMKIKLDTYADVSNENFVNYSEFFFEDMLFTALKQTPQYESNDAFRVFTDCGDKAIGAFSTLKASWELGKQIGTLIGNVVVGGEDLINRVREMRAAYDIHRALSTGMINNINGFLTDYKTASDESLNDYVRSYVSLSKYLMCCEMRGEYCLYSIVASDAGLISKFNVKNAKGAENWYVAQCKNIESMQEEIEDLLSYDDIPSDIMGINERSEISADSNGTIETVTSGERDVVLVLDTSGSMSGTPLDETQNASIKFIETIMKENASVGIVTYDDIAERISNFSTNENSLKQLVSDIQSGGSTNIEAGLQEAYSMLRNSRAQKKIIVLMSDGLPNEGRMDDDLVAYADGIKNENIMIYTLGFFEDVLDKASAQALMEQIASDGCHYEVADADSLVYFFGDVADQINGQKYIYVRIACPVEVSVSYDGETLCSSEKEQNLRTNFGSLTFEENEDLDPNAVDNRVKVLRLKEGVDYDLSITGTGSGVMNYTIGFMDDNGEYTDFRRFENVKITRKTEIDTVASVASTSILNIDQDGDGKYDLKLRAEENSYGEEVTGQSWIFWAILGAGVLIFCNIVVLVVLRRRKNKESRE